MSLGPGERERLDALVAAYRRLPRAEPSPELDAAVLHGARNALRSGGRPRWPALLATAATMTLAVGLAWQLREAEDRIEAERPGASSAPPVAPAEAPAAPPPAAYEEAVAGSRDARANAARAERPLEDAPVAPEPQARSEPGAAPATQASRRAAEHDAAPGPRPSAPASAPVARRIPAAPPESVREPKLARDQETVRAKTEATSRDAPLPAAEPAPEVATDERLLESIPAPAPAMAPPPDPFPDERQAPASPAAPAPPPPPPAEPARAPAPAVVAPVLTKKVDTTGERRRDAPARAGIGQAQRADSGPQPREPDEWLGEILRLLRAGERERAIVSLRDFREAHPEVELPPELRDLLP